MYSQQLKNIMGKDMRVLKPVKKKGLEKPKKPVREKKKKKSMFGY